LVKKFPVGPADIAIKTGRKFGMLWSLWEPVFCVWGRNLLEESDVKIFSQFQLMEGEVSCALISPSDADPKAAQIPIDRDPAINLLAS
jgi:hypothetical protein